MNRRDFIQKSALSAAGIGLSPLFGSSFSSIYGATSPNNKVKVALIGCRSMGFSDLSTFYNIQKWNVSHYVMLMMNGSINGQLM